MDFHQSSFRDLAFIAQILEPSPDEWNVKMTNCSFCWKNYVPQVVIDGYWWRHQMETFSALLAICAGNSPVPVNSLHKGQWRGALMFSLISASIKGWVNNQEAGDLRRSRPHYDVIVMLVTHTCCLFYYHHGMISDDYHSFLLDVINHSCLTNVKCGLAKSLFKLENEWTWLWVTKRGIRSLLWNLKCLHVRMRVVDW